MQTKDTVECPYNRTHRMPKSRLHWHIIQCTDYKRNKHLYEVCPYNSIHHIRREHLEAHKGKCPNKPECESEVYDEIKMFLLLKAREKEETRLAPNDIYLPEPHRGQKFIEKLRELSPPPGFDIPGKKAKRREEEIS